MGSPLVLIHAKTIRTEERKDQEGVLADAREDHRAEIDALVARQMSWEL